MGLLQAAFTELQNDEAYYWVYARFLDWGYFDHPPMIAVLIRAGDFLGGEAGVRFFSLLLSTAALWITEGLLERKDRLLFYAICLSIALFQLVGFWAVPDTPLVFFTALFFLGYQRFLQKSSWGNTLLLGAVAALLLYSKYHGVLIVFFTLLSNVSLFKRPQTYAAGFFALFLFLPHLWWQHTHNWVSIRYHLFESNAAAYRISYTLEYVGGQLLLPGPFAGLILLPAAFLYRPQSPLEKALKFIAAGVYLFFLLSSLKGRVEANWPVPALIPVMILAHQYLAQRKGGKRWLYRLLPLTLLLITAARVVMIFDVLPLRSIVSDFHLWTTPWTQQLKKRTRDVPTVFNNSYQRASKAWFYLGRPAYSLNSYKERRNNYNFWPLEDSLLGKPVYNMDIYNVSRFSDSVRSPRWTVGFSFDSAFHSFAKVQLLTDATAYAIKSGDTLAMGINAHIPLHYKTYLDQHPATDAPVIIGVFRQRKWMLDILTNTTLQQWVKQPQRNLQLPVTLPTGEYTLRFAIGSDAGFYTYNSEAITLIISP